MARRDDAALQQRGGDLRADLLRRIEEAARGAVLDELDRAEQAFAAHLADDRLVGRARRAWLVRK